MLALFVVTDLRDTIGQDDELVVGSLRDIIQRSNDNNEFDTIIFLSDGAPRRDNTPIPPEQVLNGVRVLNRFAKSRIHSIGFAQAGGNLRSFLQRLANENDGTLTLLE